MIRAPALQVFSPYAEQADKGAVAREKLKKRVTNPVGQVPIRKTKKRRTGANCPQDAVQNIP